MTKVTELVVDFRTFPRHLTGNQQSFRQQSLHGKKESHLVLDARFCKVSVINV